MELAIAGLRLGGVVLILILHGATLKVMHHPTMPATDTAVALLCVVGTVSHGAPFPFIAARRAVSASNWRLP